MRNMPCLIGLVCWHIRYKYLFFQIGKFHIITTALYEKKLNFKKELMNNEKIIHFVSQKELDEIFDISNFLKNVDVIYKRVGIKK